MLTLLGHHDDGHPIASPQNGIYCQYESKDTRLMETDRELDPIIQPRVKMAEKAHHKDIFLTGSTGFLGAYLLNELLQQTNANIYCLIRSSTPRQMNNPRVFYLNGDLTRRKLGISDEQYLLLSSKIRSIYHCGASVHFLKPYEELRAPNVFGSIEIIKLACLANARINYISTLSTQDQSNTSGYADTKRVAELLMEQARSRSLSVSIIRPGKSLITIASFQDM